MDRHTFILDLTLLISFDDLLNLQLLWRKEEEERNRQQDQNKKGGISLERSEALKQVVERSFGHPIPRSSTPGWMGA